MAETTSKAWQLGIAAANINTAAKSLSDAFVALARMGLVDEAHAISAIRDELQEKRMRIVSDNLKIVVERTPHETP